MSRQFQQQPHHQQPGCSSDLPTTPGSVDTQSPPSAMPLKQLGLGPSAKSDLTASAVAAAKLNHPEKSQLPYHFEFVKVSILLCIGLYMALSGFLAYMFIKQQVSASKKPFEIPFVLSLTRQCFMQSMCRSITIKFWQRLKGFLSWNGTL